MSPKEINWDAELAKVDKVMGSGGASGAPAPVTPRPSAPAPVASRRAIMATWLRLVLALLVGIGMTQWPYLHGCGIPLFLYMGAVLTVIVASLWSLVSSWRSRSTLAHGLSVVLLIWGLGLGAREVLPRVGYAKAAATWLCAQPKP